jgi:hypothetical protein
MELLQNSNILVEILEFESLYHLQIIGQLINFLDLQFKDRQHTPQCKLEAQFHQYKVYEHMFHIDLCKYLCTLIRMESYSSSYSNILLKARND